MAGQPGEEPQENCDLDAELACRRYEKWRLCQTLDRLEELQQKLHLEPPAGVWSVEQLWRTSEMHLAPVTSLTCAWDSSGEMVMASSASDETTAIQETVPGGRLPEHLAYVDLPKEWGLREVQATAFVPLHSDISSGWAIAVAGSRRREVLIWAQEDCSMNSKDPRSIAVEEDAEVLNLNGCGDGDLLVATTVGVEVFSVINARKRRFFASRGPVTCAKMASHHLLASVAGVPLDSTSSSSSHVVALWDMREERTVATLSVAFGTNRAGCLDVLTGQPGGVVAAAGGRTFQAWDLRHTLRSLVHTDQLPANVASLSLDPGDGALVAIGCEEPDASQGSLLLGSLASRDGRFEIVRHGLTEAIYAQQLVPSNTIGARARNHAALVAGDASGRCVCLLPNKVHE